MTGWGGRDRTFVSRDQKKSGPSVFNASACKKSAKIYANGKKLRKKLRKLLLLDNFAESQSSLQVIKTFGLGFELGF